MLGQSRASRAVCYVLLTLLGICGLALKESDPLNPSTATALEATLASEPAPAAEPSPAHATPLRLLARWVEAFGFLLIAIGLAGAFLEVKSPGFGVAGFISVIAFSTFFFGNYLAENLAGWETVLVFVIGLCLVILEVIFLGGGSIAVGVIGGLFMLSALAVSLVDRAAWEDYHRGLETSPSLASMFQGPVLSVAAGVVLTIILMMLLLRYLPGTGPFRWMVLKTAVPGGTRVKPTSTEPAPLAAGTVGVAATDLRPAGKGRFGQAVYDVSSDTLFIRKGEPIRIVQVRGDGIVIDRAE